MSMLKVFFHYIKSHMKALFVFTIFSVIFAVVFHLYSLPMEAVGYSILLCICTGFIFGFFDFYKYYNKHNSLYEQLNRIMLSIENLPIPENLLEQDYQKLIEAIHTEKAKILSDCDNTTNEMVEYYTLWAHQIKTPIAAMKLLLQSEESEQQAELLSELFKTEQYVEMVLQYLRLGSTSSDYLLKKYDLDNIVKQAIRKYARMFINKKINLVYSELNYQVLTDEKWLVFVIEQILSNALKYTNEGRITIRLEAETLIIEDTGIGISKEDLPRVFEKGYTGYNGRIDKKSTGIGLYLCKKILTRLSQTVQIESVVDKGTTVRIGFSSQELLH